MSENVKRLSPTAETIKFLLLRSGNQCAFPGCTHKIYNDANTLIGECCHIEAAMPGGERFNAESTNEQRRSAENLIFLCHQHHVETDDTEKYPVERMKKIKLEHESQFQESKEIPASIIEQVKSQFSELLPKVDSILKNSEEVRNNTQNISNSLSDLENLIRTPSRKELYIQQNSSLKIPLDFFLHANLAEEVFDGDHPRIGLGERLFEQIQEENGEIFLLAGDGGTGKTHILKRVYELVDASGMFDKILCYEPGVVTFQDSASANVHQNESCFFIFDDAGRYGEEDIVPLLSHLKNNPKHSLLLALRKADLQTWLNANLKAKTNSLVYKDVFEVPAWKKSELKRVLRAAYGNEFVPNESSIIEYFPNPWYIHHYAKFIKYEAGIDIESFWEELIMDLQNGLQKVVESEKIELGKSGQNLFLLFLALSQPFRASYNQSALEGWKSKDLDFLSELIDLNENRLITLLNRLLSFAFLKDARGKLLFTSEMLRDTIVRNYFSNHSSHEWQPKLEAIRKHDPIRVLKNLSESRRALEVGFFDDYISQVLETWENNSDDKENGWWNERIDEAVYFAKLAPELGLKFLDWYIEAQFGIDTEKENLDSPSTLLLVKMIKVYRILDSASELLPPQPILSRINEIWKLAIKIEPYTLGKQTHKERIKGYFVSRPNQISLDDILEGLTFVQEWIGVEKPDWSAHLTSLLQNLLCYSLRYYPSNGKSILLGSAKRNLNSSVRLVRAKAMELVKRFLTSEDSEEFENGMKIASAIGGSEGGGLGEHLTPEPEELKLFSEEREQVTNLLKPQISEKTPFHKLILIEDFLLVEADPQIWDSVAAMEILKNFPRPLGYRVFLLLRDNYDPFWGWDRIRQEIEKDTKLPRARTNIFREPQAKEEKVYKLAQELKDRNFKPESLLPFLKNISSQMNGRYFKPDSGLFEEWVKADTAMFVSIRENSQLWSSVPANFQSPIEVALQAGSFNVVAAKEEEIASSWPDVPKRELDNHLRLLSQENDKALFESWLSRIVNEGDNSHRAGIGYWVLKYSETNPDKTALLFADLIQKEGLEFDSCGFLLREFFSKENKAETVEIESLHNQVRNLLIKEPVWLKTQLSVVNKLFTKPMEFLHLLRERIEYAKTLGESPGSRCEIRPSAFEKAIKIGPTNFEEFSTFADNIFELQSEPLFVLEDWKSSFIGLVRIGDPGASESWSEYYISNLIQTGEIEKAAEMAFLVHPEKGRNSNLFSDLFEATVKRQERQLARSILEGLFPKPGVYGIEEGVPKPYLNRKAFLEEMIPSIKDYSAMKLINGYLAELNSKIDSKKVD